MSQREDRAIHALILDMDGLLVDTEHLAALALEQFLARHGRTMAAGTMEQTLGRRLPEAMAIVAAAYGLTDPLATLTAEYDALRLETLRGNVRPMPGARELLEWGRAAALPMALATSSRRSHAELSLGEAQLAGFFAAEVTGEEVQHGKPSPDIFLTAASRLGIPPASCLVLEDAPAGLTAAVAGGMRCLWVPNDNTRALSVGVPVDGVVTDLHQARIWIEEQRGRVPPPSF
ncbi:MAG: HAD family phosphatase [Chloroflexia bacterium]|nr:HAD family phosphatase [Chloroflexia bacterium]